MFKCEIYLMQESIDSDGNCTGDASDSGLIETITAATLLRLLGKLDNKWTQEFKDTLEVFDNRLEGSLLNREDKCYDTYSVYISEVTEKQVGAGKVMRYFKALK